MKSLKSVPICFICCVGLAGASTVARPQSPDEQLSHIEAVIQDGIRQGECPGAVVLVGHQGKIVYRRAFGNRSLVPAKEPMTADTVFDLASLTKVVATTTAIMQLVEQGKIRLQEPVSEYWPEFKANGKDEITVRELMTHYSGLQPDLDLKPEWSGYGTALRMIIGESPVAPPGTRFIYSDINFETLGELVRRVSGEPLDVYCAKHIFTPLGMKDTKFNPPAIMRQRIAPTEYKGRKLLWGEVNDPTSYNMGGVAGHAGIFSTADDLAIFAQMLLDGGTYQGVRILSPPSVEKMSTPQNPPGKHVLRGLGWDIDSSFSSSRGELFPIGSYGHTGYTGTSIWIDPSSKTFIIILTSRLHPNGKGDVVGLRARVATVVAAAFGVTPDETAAGNCCPTTGYFELKNSYGRKPAKNAEVKTGIDVLEEQKFAPLAGLRVGLITNHTGRDAAGNRTIDLLFRAPKVKLKAIFAPEHGLIGEEDSKAPDAPAKDAGTGVPVYSLYSGTLRPTDKMLKNLDALVFDIQDAGVRFYTYITTLGFAMEEAAKRQITVYVLDRPNPITGILVEGPMLDPDLTSFVGYFPMPIRHGMTVGELARMFNAEKGIGARLEVIKMRGWHRDDWYDDTGLPWIGPSPNLRNMTEAALYPGVAMVEGANISVGRGTDTPFELLGAPWIDGRKLAAYFKQRQVQGVRFMSADFTPSSGPFAGKICHGVNIVLLDRMALNSPALGIELASALRKLSPDKFEIDRILPLVGARGVVDSLKNGRDPASIVLHSYEALEQFRKVRGKYLLYP